MRNLLDLEIAKIKKQIPLYVGEQIINFRKLKLFTQTELAELVGKIL